MTTLITAIDLAIPPCDGVVLTEADIDALQQQAAQLSALLYPDEPFETSGREADFSLSLARLCERLALMAPLTSPERASVFMARIGCADEVSMAEAWLFCIYVLCVDSVEHVVPHQPIAMLRSVCRQMQSSSRTFTSPDEQLDRHVVYES